MNRCSLGKLAGCSTALSIVRLFEVGVARCFTPVSRQTEVTSALGWWDSGGSTFSAVPRDGRVYASEVFTPSTSHSDFCLSLVLITFISQLCVLVSVSAAAGSRNLAAGVPPWFLTAAAPRQSCRGQLRRARVLLPACARSPAVASVPVPARARV